MESRSSRHNIREFVDSLLPGSRVIWIANGAMGTIQPDRSILWDDGHHMTRKQMNDSHALLIHSEAERVLLQDALNRRLECTKCGCTLVRWSDAECKQNLPERLCPIGLVSEVENPLIVGPRSRSLKNLRPRPAS